MCGPAPRLDAKGGSVLASSSNLFKAHSKPSRSPADFVYTSARSHTAISCGRRSFHGDLDAELPVLAQVGHTEPTSVEDSRDAIGTQPGAGSERLFVILGTRAVQRSTGYVRRVKTRSMQRHLRVVTRPRCGLRRIVPSLDGRGGPPSAEVYDFNSAGTRRGRLHDRAQGHPRRDRQLARRSRLLPLRSTRRRLFFTFYLGFPRLRYFKRAWGVLSGATRARTRKATRRISKRSPPRAFRHGRHRQQHRWRRLRHLPRRVATSRCPMA